MKWDPRIRDVSSENILRFFDGPKTKSTISDAKAILTASGLVHWPKSSSQACFMIPPLLPAAEKNKAARKDAIVVDDE